MLIALTSGLTRKRVADDLGVYCPAGDCKVTRKHKVTTDSNHKFNIAPNLLDRDFNVNKPNQKWASDISYVWTRECWSYLAVILDLSSRRVIGWAVTPINKSTGGKERLGRISKMGDRYIRRLMVVGMTSRIKQIKSAPERFDPWFADILQRKPTKLAAIAMANKTARIIWAVLSRNEPYEVRKV